MAGGGSGTVTTVSVATANGFTGYSVPWNGYFECLDGVNVTTLEV